MRRLVEPVRADVDVLPYVRFPAVGRNVEKARLAAEVSASAFAEAVSYLVSEGDIDSDAVMVPLRGTPIAYPMDSAMIAVAASRRRGVALAVDTFYREVGNRLWTAVFMSSARNESGKVIGLCYGVYVEAAGDGVVIGVEELPISAMVPGTKKISTRMNCLPGEDGVSNPSDLE